MVILTCANSEIAIEGKHRFLHRKFSFKRVILETIDQAKKCGYIAQVYDLGTLGIGDKFEVADESFAQKGYYDRVTQRGYRSKSLFKPEVVKMCMDKYDDLVVYLDGDVQLCGNIDEIATADYDVGVTLRDKSELESQWHKEHFQIVKYVNAGVIFFNPTPATTNFVRKWQKQTDEFGNDQRALNALTCGDSYPKPYSVATINGIRIKYFPCCQYNFYSFNDGVGSDIKMMHFKGPVRHYYPFDFKKKFYCKYVIPVLKKLGHFVKTG